MALEKAGSGSVEDRDFNALVDALRGVAVVADRTLTQTLGAGTYTATFDLPANSVVFGIWVKTTVEWDDIDPFPGVQAVMGDSDDPHRFHVGFDITQVGGYLSGDFQFVAGSSDEWLFYENGTTITFSAVSEGNGESGRSRVQVCYASGIATAAAVKA